MSASRFAHYIKVIMREKIGKFMTRSNVEDYLNTWIAQYILLVSWFMGFWTSFQDDGVLIGFLILAAITVRATAAASAFVFGDEAWPTGPVEPFEL